MLRFVRSSSCFLTLVPASFVVLVAFVACGGGKGAEGAVHVPTAGTSSASAPMVAALASLGPLPATAEVPAPGVVGSRKVTMKRDAAFDICQRTVAGEGKDLARDLERLATACATATKFKPASEVLRATVDDGGPAKTFSVRFQKGHCYRMYSASSPALRSIALSLRDADGATIIDTHTDVAPTDGALCFSSDDTATLLVASGSGKGDIAVRVYGD